MNLVRENERETEVLQTLVAVNAPPRPMRKSIPHQLRDTVQTPVLSEPELVTLLRVFYRAYRYGAG